MPTPEPLDTTVSTQPSLPKSDPVPKVGRLKRWDNSIHNYLSAKFPIAIPIVGSVLRWLYGVSVSPAFAVLLALLLVGFVISGEIPIIVSVSAICAWVIVCLAITKIDWVAKQRIFTKILVLVLSALVLFYFTRVYVDWCLRHYQINKARDDKDKNDQESQTIRSALQDAVKKLPVQPSIDTAPSTAASKNIASPSPKPEGTTKTKKLPSISPAAPQNSIATPSEPIQNYTTPNTIQVAQFQVTQSTETTDRPDEPNEISVVVQTNTTFPSLRLAIECDGPISEGRGGITGIMMMTSQGVANGYPNIYLFTYQSATPQFGPSSPLVFRFWSKAPITCKRARLF